MLDLGQFKPERDPLTSTPGAIKQKGSKITKMAVKMRPSAHRAFVKKTSSSLASSSRRTVFFFFESRESEREEVEHEVYGGEIPDEAEMEGEMDASQPNVDMSTADDDALKVFLLSLSL